MLVIVFLVSCFVSVERAWKAYLLLLAIGIELLLCIQVFAASSSYVYYFGSPGLMVILEAGAFNSGFPGRQRTALDLFSRKTIPKDHLDSK
jgi:hypothetical protein